MHTFGSLKGIVKLYYETLQWNIFIVLLVESELEMILEKVTRGKMWSSLGALLPGNAEMTPRYSDTNGKLIKYKYM